ncbi:MAG: hypothetical protein K1X83_04105 [Oligoflexia bacterium]|nr:hypothetical protein [Oligoflexia bacterium]
MEQIEIIKLAIDVTLAFSLGYLCLRLLRNPSPISTSRELQHLEGSLRSLIDEATRSGRALNDQLVRRQTDMERLLSEMSASESRINRTVAAANERRAALETEPARPARGQATEIEHAEYTTPARVPAEPIWAVAPVTHQAPEPPSFRAAPSNERHVEQPTPAAVKPRSAKRQVNIYGEEINEATEPEVIPAAPAPRGLRSQIEKERVYGAESDPKRGIQDIYSAAEEMLKAGESLHKIAAVTNLPAEDLQMLAQVVRREQSVNAASNKARANAPIEVIEEPPAPVRGAPADPRLGVLGSGIKRQVEVL